MPIDDPQTWVQGATAWKAAVEGLRTTVSMVKEVWSGRGTEQEQKAIDNALTVASSNIAIAEAQLAQAFGYELCRCQFPPTAMLRVGHLIMNIDNKPVAGRRAGDPVYECPKCGADTAGPYNYQRMAPKRPTV
jgi:hypothetical protein